MTRMRCIKAHAVPPNIGTVRCDAPSEAAALGFDAWEHHDEAPEPVTDTIYRRLRCGALFIWRDR